MQFNHVFKQSEGPDVQTSLSEANGLPFSRLKKIQKYGVTSFTI
jgi:hypothetical protein